MQPNFNATDAAFLEQYIGNWITLRDAKYIKHLDPFVPGQYQEIYRRSLDPRALFCMTCTEDVMQMIRILYTNYEAWKAGNVPLDPPAPETLDIVGQDQIEMAPGLEVFPDVLDTLGPDPGDQVPVQYQKGKRGRPSKK